MRVTKPQIRRGHPQAPMPHDGIRRGTVVPVAALNVRPAGLVATPVVVVEEVHADSRANSGTGRYFLRRRSCQDRSAIQAPAQAASLAAAPAASLGTVIGASAAREE